jgi:hypothetical protein
MSRWLRLNQERSLAVKSLKLFVDPAHAHTPTGGVTFAHPGAKPGPVRDRARNILITSIPDDVSNETVRKAYAGTADGTRPGGHERYTFAWSELG